MTFSFSDYAVALSWLSLRVIFLIYGIRIFIITSHILSGLLISLACVTHCWKRHVLQVLLLIQSRSFWRNHVWLGQLINVFVAIWCFHWNQRDTVDIVRDRILTFLRSSGVWVTSIHTNIEVPATSRDLSAINNSSAAHMAVFAAAAIASHALSNINSW